MKSLHFLLDYQRTQWRLYKSLNLKCIYSVVNFDCISKALHVSLTPFPVAMDGFVLCPKLCYGGMSLASLCPQNSKPLTSVHSESMWDEFLLLLSDWHWFSPWDQKNSIKVVNYCPILKSPSFSSTIFSSWAHRGHHKPWVCPSLCTSVSMFFMFYLIDWNFESNT